MTKINSLPFLQVVTDITSKYNKIRNEDYLKEGLYPIIDQGQPFIGGYSNNTSLIIHSSSSVIVFGDHTKTLKFIDFPFAIGADGVKVFKVDEKYAVARYIYYFLKTIKLPEAGYSRHFKYLKDVKLPILESLSDQLHIANILTQAENLIAQRKESIRLLDEFIKSTFLGMFGTPSMNIKRFAKGTIRDVANEVKYGTSSPAEDEGHYPYLRMNNITTEGYWDFSKLKYINIEDKDKEKYVVRKGDLLFNRTNSKELVGKSGVFNEEAEMIIAGYLIRVRTNEKANPWYLWGYLNSVHGKQTLFGMCKSIVGMANINAQELQSIKILIPPIALQNQFAQIVEKTESLKTQYQQSLQELESLYGSLSQRAFKGELRAKDGEMMKAAEAVVKYQNK